MEMRGPHSRRESSDKNWRLSFNVDSTRVESQAVAVGEGRMPVVRDAMCQSFT